ncbi:MAG: sugar transferase [Acidimicrobiia bacterium]
MRSAVVLDLRGGHAPGGTSARSAVIPDRSGGESPDGDQRHRGGADPLELPVNLNSRYAAWGKPVFDRVVGTAAFVVLSPVLGVTAVAVRRKLGKGCLFRQRRVGQYGKPFTIFKFRTMLPDRRSGVDRRSEPRSDAVDRRVAHKTDADPRLTPFGRRLRKASLDELPQLVNVLKGEMSLVGPRPELSSVVVQHYRDDQHRRHVVKPGLTGLWQVTMRGQGNDGEMYRHTDIDLEYVEKMSFRTDLKILAATVRTIVKS